MTRFIVLFPGRTGSSHLMSCLASRPDVTAEGERLVRRPAAWQQRWIRRLYTQPGRELARGFKTKLKDVWDLDELRTLLHELDVRVIVMRRRNTVKLAVSTLNARRLKERTGLWNRRRGDAPLEPFAPTIEALEATVNDCVRRDKELAAYVESLELSKLTVDYEDLLADEAGCLAKVATFLDLPPAPTRSEIVKATDDDLSKALENYEELKAHFAGGPFERMF